MTFVVFAAVTSILIAVILNEEFLQRISLRSLNERVLRKVAWLTCCANLEIHVSNQVLFLPVSVQNAAPNKKCYWTFLISAWKSSLPTPEKCCGR